MDTGGKRSGYTTQKRPQRSRPIGSGLEEGEEVPYDRLVGVLGGEPVVEEGADGNESEVVSGDLLVEVANDSPGLGGGSVGPGFCLKFVGQSYGETTVSGLSGELGLAAVSLGETGDAESGIGFSAE